MLCPDNVQKLLKHFTEKGWNAREAETALAGEIADGQAGDLQRTRNFEVIQGSGGILPKMHVEEIQVLTIAGSHTTTVLRLIDAAGHDQYRTQP